MSILQLTLAKSQVRITNTAEDELLQQHLDAAELHCARFLNRNLYPDDAALSAAIAAVTRDSLDAAQATYDAAQTAWLMALDACGHAVPPLADVLAWEKALRDYKEMAEATRMTYYGAVIDTPITQAVLLLFAHFANNREAVLTDAAKAIELPLGVQCLLAPYRVREGV